MYTITGATGRVGGAAARHLLADGQPVRALVRNPTTAGRLAHDGAELRVADLGDRAALAAGLRGSRGAFVLLPFDLTVTDFFEDAHRLVHAIAGAVADSGVPHVVVLSPAGADLAHGTGPIVGLHHLEERLRATGAVVSALRSGHFQEKVTDVLDPARHTGVYPSFGPPDVAKPMIATRDVGAVVARLMQSPPTDDEVVDLDGPSYTERQVADLLGTVLGRRLEVVEVPRAGWADGLVDAGFPRHIAELLAELYAADEDGRLRPRGDRTMRCATGLEATLADLVGTPG